MAISALPQSTGQQAQATAEAPGPGGRSVREQFDALPERLKAEILDKHRHWNVEHVDWWDGVYEQFGLDMDAIGIEVEVDKMYFSGFWSQGDGACFEGHVSDWGLFLGSLGYTCPALIKHADAAFQFSVEHRGHYYHENCTSFSSQLPLPEHDEDQDFMDNHLFTLEEDSVQMAVTMALLNTHSEAKLEDEFTEAFKDHMRELYKRLEAEYEHQTSDEAILDSLEANEQLEDAINDAMESNDA